MSLFDLLLKGPVKVMDMDHEQYGEAAALRRQGFVVLDGDLLRPTEAGALFVVSQAIRSLESKGLAANFPDGAIITPEGLLIAKGSARTM